MILSDDGPTVVKHRVTKAIGFFLLVIGWWSRPNHLPKDFWSSSMPTSTYQVSPAQHVCVAVTPARCPPRSTCPLRNQRHHVREERYQQYKWYLFQVGYKVQACAACSTKHNPTCIHPFFSVASTNGIHAVTCNVSMQSGSKYALSAWQNTIGCYYGYTVIRSHHKVMSAAANHMSNLEWNMTATF